MHLWHDQWRSPDVEPLVHVNALMVMPLFLSNPRAWAIMPFCMAHYLKDVRGMEIHELLSPPPKTTYYKLMPRYLHPDRAEAINRFCRYLDDYLETIDWLDKEF